MHPQLTEVFVFKTNLVSDEHIRKISFLLNNHPSIQKWNVDREDIDRVLRIVPKAPIEPGEIIQAVQKAGFSCEELTD